MLRLRVNEAKSAVALAKQRQFLGFSFWGPGRGGEAPAGAQSPEADEGPRASDHLTHRGSQPRASVRGPPGDLQGWKHYFRLTDTPTGFANLDQWIRHRSRALQLKQWKRGRTIYRELCARGMSRRAAAQVAANGRRWWRNSAMAIHIALPNSLFDELGFPGLPRNLNPSNRPVRTRSPGGVAGVMKGYPSSPYADFGRLAIR